MEYKIEFVHALGDILRKYSQEAVDKIEYEYKVSVDLEYAVITYKNGYVKKVCITGDSCIVIMNDIYLAML